MDQEQTLINPAQNADWDWIQGTYAHANFLLSDLEQDLILVARVGGVRAGLGRIIRLETGELELGGMIVLDEFRRRGIATRLVSGLLERADHEQIFCLPFTHLSAFYEGFGFRKLEPTHERVPASLRDKLELCRTTFEHPTTLMFFDSPVS